MRARSFLANRTRNDRSKIIAWYERDGGNRLAHDRELIRLTYPDLVFEVSDAAQVHLRGVIALRADCGVVRAFGVRIEFPVDYPAHEPRVFDVGNEFPYEADRHFLPNGRCCMWLPCETQWRSADPDALLAFLDQVAVFYDRQVVYDALPPSRKRWPGPQRGHGVFGYIDLVQERLGGDLSLVRDLAPILVGGKVGRNMPCPCGSGAKYKRCHERQVQAIRSLIGADLLRSHFQKWLKVNTISAGADPGAADTSSRPSCDGS